MRRRTKRVRLNPRPFIVLGLGVNLAAGVALSPVTAVRRVRVEGAPEADRERLTLLLQSLKGVPCARVDARTVESKALENSELRGASLARTPFGSAVLRVARRVPVARLFGDLDTGLSADGVLYRASQLPKDLPTVNLTFKYSKNRPHAWERLAYGRRCLSRKPLARARSDGARKDRSRRGGPSVLKYR